MDSGSGEEKWKMGKEERPKAKERYDCVISSRQRNGERVWMSCLSNVCLEGRQRAAAAGWLVEAPAWVRVTVIYFDVCLFVFLTSQPTVVDFPQPSSGL